MNNILDHLEPNQEIHNDNTPIVSDGCKIPKKSKVTVKKFKKLKKQIKFQISELRNDDDISEKKRKKRIKQLKALKKYVEAEIQGLKQDIHQLNQSVGVLNVRVNKIEKYHADILVDKIINMTNKKLQHEEIMRLIRGNDGYEV